MPADTKNMRMDNRYAKSSNELWSQIKDIKVILAIYHNMEYISETSESTSNVASNQGISK